MRFIDLLGYREITLKSDTEPAIVAFRNRVAAMCKAEVSTEDAVKRDKESNGLIENAVMLLRGNVRTIKCHIESRTQEPLSDDSPVIPWLVEHAGCILRNCMVRSRHKSARKVVTEGRHLNAEELHLSGTQKPTQEFEWTPIQSLRCRLREQVTKQGGATVGECKSQRKSTSTLRSECESKNATELLREQKGWIEEMR